MFKLKIPLLILSTCLIFSLCSSCCKYENPAGDDSKVIVRINNYDMTVADFKAELRALSPGKLSAADFEKAKEKLLDEVITKKILVQEAQRQNLDKEKSFVKEIELYWEQALLKLLYDKESRKLSRDITNDVTIAPASRDRKTQEALNSWIEGLRARSAIKKYKDTLQYIKPE